MAAQILIFLISCSLKGAFAIENTADAYYRAGMNYYGLNQYGMALAYFEKSDRLSAGNAEVRKVLDLALSQTEAQWGVDRIYVGESSLEALARQVPLVWISVPTMLIALFFFFSSIRKNQKPYLALGFAILALSCSAIETWNSRSPQAVLVATISAYSSPSARSIALTELQPGMNVRIRGSGQKGWVRVSIGPDLAGWVPESSLLLL